MKRRILRQFSLIVMNLALIIGIVGFSGTNAVAKPVITGDRSVVVTSSYEKMIQQHEGLFNLARQVNTSGKKHHKPKFRIAKQSPQKQAWYLLPHKNRSNEYSCLNNVIMRESGWNIYAENPNSGAYGIPQALPGDKMAGMMHWIHRDGSRAGKWYYGKRWQNTSYVQLFWMVRKYIPSHYGDSCAAWAHEQNYGWY